MPEPESPSPAQPPLLSRLLTNLGQPALNGTRYLGRVSWLLVDTARWIYRSVVRREVRFGRFALYSQIVRVGLRSVGVITLVCACIGTILALQMAPPLEEFGQVEQVANIISIAVVRELGPLIAAIVLAGFAGASITAELGTMVVGEEIEALQAHALNPVRFLVMPRLLATTASLVVLAVVGDLVALTAGWAVGVTVLDIPSGIYIHSTLTQLDLADYTTGLVKAAVFGLILGAIACTNGLAVVGGAAGVGIATTRTVVHSIVSIIFTDMLFTAVFFKLGWT